MRESVIESYLVSCVAALKGLALKLGIWGWPDRLVLLPGGILGFIELKAPGERPRALQLKRLDQLTALGFIATWADSHAGVTAFLESLTHRQPVPAPVSGSRALLLA